MQLLDRLEQVWRRLESPMVGLLRPGLSDDQIDELMAPTGLTLPNELRLWWRWHDGAPAPKPGGHEVRRIGPTGWMHLPLSEAIDVWHYHEGSYMHYLDIGATDLADLAWRPGLFPFTNSAGGRNHILGVDTLVSDNAPAPVAMITAMGIENWAGADSVSEVLGLWIELLESGRYHLEDDSWQPLDPFYAEDSRFLWLL